MTDTPALRRQRDDRMVAGVCGGLARCWDIDPLLVRLAFVVASLATAGTALLGYAALWALLPEAGDDRLLPAPIRNWTPAKLVSVMSLAVVLASVAVPGLGPGLTVIALAGGVIWYLNAQRTPSRKAPSSGPAGAGVQWAAPPPRNQVTRADRTRSTLPLSAQRPVVGPTHPLPPARPVVPPTQPLPARRPVVPPDFPRPPLPTGPRPARRFGAARAWLFIVLACGLVWAGLGAVDATLLRVPTLAWWSGTLLVLGLALLVGARRASGRPGRLRGLLPLALAVAIGTAVTMADEPLTRGSMQTDSGTRAIASADALKPSTDLPMGSHTVDLSGLAVATDTERHLQLDAGTLTIILPPDANVEIRYSVDLGNVVYPGAQQSGVDNSGTFLSAPRSGAPTLVLIVNVDTGKLEIRR